MALTGTDRGTGSTNTAAETTLVISPASTIAAGTMAVLCGTWDNSVSGGADPFVSIVDNLNNIWTSRQAALRDPNSAEAGCATRIFTCYVGGAITSSNTITISFGSTVTVARAWTIMEIGSDTAGKRALYVSGNVASNSSTNATITTASITSGNMVIGAAGIENTAAVTTDTDTSNGSWSTAQQATVGSGNTGIQITSQRKVTTGTATQTYNNTISVGDWAIAYIEAKEADVGIDQLLSDRRAYLVRPS